MVQRITGVTDGSLAHQLGVRPGDELMTLNGRDVADLIDYQAFSCTEKVVLLTRRDDEELEYRFTKDAYEPLGLQFDRPLMSRMRDCVNRCLFCFVDQLPKNARPSLRVKDDDWRMSLMMGNFVTLTNVSDRELARIIERRVSPLYISVHATDGALRAKLLGRESGSKIMAQLRSLKDAGLSFHAQAVLCPGLNDGAALEKTIADLVALSPSALSLALVPVGLTGCREGLCPLAPYDRAGAQRVLDAADRWREKCLKDMGTAFVFPADEFYLLAGRELPADEAYEDYAQIENGVGLVRRFETEYEEAWRAGGAARPGSYVLACGTSFAPRLTSLLERLPVPGVSARVVSVENRFFGGGVTVSGLLTGSDLIRALADEPADAVLLSASMLRDGGDVFLDDLTPADVEAAIHKKIIPVQGGAELHRALTGFGG